jgi:hypothetical protein
MNRLISVMFLLAVGGCAFRSVGASALATSGDAPTVTTPVKAHLTDGTTIVYRHGVVLTHDSLQGAGTRYGLTLGDSTAVTSVSASRVASLTRFHDHYDAAASLFTSLLSAGALIFGFIALAISNDKS